MRKIFITCDRCGQDIEQQPDDDAVSDVTFRAGREVQGKWPGKHRSTMDLCVTCATEFIGWAQAIRE